MTRIPRRILEIVAIVVVGLAMSCLAPSSASDGAPGATGASATVTVAFASPEMASTHVWESDGLLVAAAVDGSLLTSTDAATWITTVPRSSLSQNNPSFSSFAYGLVKGQGVFLVGGPSGRLFLGHKTESPWQALNPVPPSYDVTGVAFGAGVFVVTANSPAGSAPTVQSSPDGSQWLPVTMPAELGHITGVFYAHDRFFLQAYNANGDAVAYSSADGSSWALVAGLVAPYNPSLVNVVWANGVYLAGFDVGSTLLRSNDGTTWQRVYSNLSQVTGLATGKGAFWLLGQDYSSAPLVLKTSDGRAWDYPSSVLPKLDYRYTGLAWSSLVGSSGGLILSFETSSNTPTEGPIDDGSDQS